MQPADGGRAMGQWLRLAPATINARDDLRRLAAELTAAMSTGRIPRALILRARDVAAKHAEALRLALKHPHAEAPRRKYNGDVPCWSEQERTG
jgi:hypothetical protein